MYVSSYYYYTYYYVSTYYYTCALILLHVPSYYYVSSYYYTVSSYYYTYVLILLHMCPEAHMPDGCRGQNTCFGETPANPAESLAQIRDLTYSFLRVQQKKRGGKKHSRGVRAA